MKTFTKCLAALALGGSCLGAFNAAADLEVSASVQIHASADFYTPLEPHGGWVEVGSYGRCWHPAHVAVGWRPYCDGTWVWTDCGWYWESDEPWGWACYHYGTWVNDPAVGWVWVPGVEWAPAWVEWRVGGGYVGWAPLAPRGVVIAPAFFGFVEIGHFHERVRPATLVVNNTTIINRTTRINEISRESRTIDGRSQKVVVNRGPGVDAVQKATGRQISAVPIHEAALRTPAPRELSAPNRTREGGREAASPPTSPNERDRGPAGRSARPEPGLQVPSGPARDRGGESAPRIAPRDGGPPLERPSRGGDAGPSRGGGGGGGGGGDERDKDRGGGHGNR